MLTDLAKIFLSAALAAFLSGYLVARWRSRDETTQKQLDELCHEVVSVSGVASEYWQLPAADPMMHLLSYKVMAGMARINGFVSVLSEQMSEAATGEISAAVQGFSRVATGGDFGVNGRGASLDRATQVLVAAAKLTVALRRARTRDTTGLWRRR